MVEFDNRSSIPDEDLKDVMEMLSREYKGRSVAAVGFNDYIVVIRRNSYGTTFIIRDK
jgi:hypothetical protein